jgi:hypothetical protein
MLSTSDRFGFLKKIANGRAAICSPPTPRGLEGGRRLEYFFALFIDPRLRADPDGRWALYLFRSV